MTVYVPSISLAERKQLDKFSYDYFPKQVAMTIALSGGTFICVGALVVIFASCLCLTLPGINVIPHVMVRGILPGALGLAVSTVCFGIGYYYRRQQQPLRKRWVKKMIKLINDNKVEKLPDVSGKKKKNNPIGKFVQDNFFFDEKSKPSHPTFREKCRYYVCNFFWNQDFKRGIINDLDKHYKEKQKNQNQKVVNKAKKMCDSLDELKKAVMTQKKY